MKKIKIGFLNKKYFVHEPIENGKSYAKNAEIKARFYANILKKSVLAEDSGLEIKALNNFPGMRSAR